MSLAVTGLVMLVGNLLYEPGPAQIYERYKSMTGDTELPEEIIQQQVEFERQQARRNNTVSVYANLRGALAYVLVGLPVWLYHWKKIQREAAAGNS